MILGHATFLQEFIPPNHQEQMEGIIHSAMRLKAIMDKQTGIMGDGEAASPS